MSSAGMSRWWGPVFDAERVTRARRWQEYAVRALFVLGLLGSLILVWWDQTSRVGPVSVQQMATMGQTAYSTLTSLELLAALLIAPAATAGAICLDKSRGMLAHVFVTDLSNREIILGKLAARLFPVWNLLACALPVAAVATWMGGIDPVALTGSLIIVAGVAVLGCSLALMLSVWANKPHEVISAVFGIWTLWILVCPVLEIFSTAPRPPYWAEISNPFYLIMFPYQYPGETTLLEPILFALTCGMISAICAGVAVARVRVVGCRSAHVGTRKVGLIGRGVAAFRGQVRWSQGPRLDANPVYWREWHRNRPSRWSRWVWMGYYLLTTVISATLIIGRLADWTNLNDSEIPPIALGFLATVGLLLVSTSTASVLADERTRGSLDVLMSTPVSTRTILQAKWWGSFRRVPWLGLWPLILGLSDSIARQPSPTQLAIIYLMPVLIVAQGAALVSLGLALATWIKRTGQATAWTVALLMASVVGWPIVGSFLPLTPQMEYTLGPAGNVVVTNQPVYTTRTVVLDWLLSLGSPFYNTALPLISASMDSQPGLIRNQFQPQAFVILLVGWTVAYSLLALILFEATVRTFDRCLGRSPERPIRPQRQPPTHRSGLRSWNWPVPRLPGRSLSAPKTIATPK